MSSNLTSSAGYANPEKGMNGYLIYFTNILFLALPIAIFEIIIEKDKGWGSGWRKDKWYAKRFAPNNPVVRLMVKMFGAEYPLNYHFLVFAVFIPLVFVSEYIYLTSNILLLLASLIGVLAFEDFFWFLFNWNFDSLGQLLKGPNGSIWWYKDWAEISPNFYLPRYYFYSFPSSLVLLIIYSFTH